MTDTRFAQLISKIAHELRSPLTSIKGFSATLVKRWDSFTDEQRFQFVETINADAERMARIVSEVLDLARMEAGTLQLTRVNVHLKSVVEKAAENVARLGGSDRLRISIDDDLLVMGDPERLQHVLGNLLENGIKFSDEGPIDISARASKGEVEISISDRGVGIEAERMEHLFEGPAPPGSSATPSGSGLGLYLARRLVEAHGGSIEVSSKVGEGSTFVLQLPSGTET